LTEADDGFVVDKRGAAVPAAMLPEQILGTIQTLRSVPDGIVLPELIRVDALILQSFPVPSAIGRRQVYQRRACGARRHPSF
jgi:hypothetical protein